ncbi:Starch-binding associating with outer membrane [Fodinibius roseus]|uniref:Starch-binding associating with outer membrane n=1 Tax=Fodinibius roseus TaxID=1194090 RepID=A0A1M5F1C6_9BACT|nr:RagB/SusD family nutrient uptake outer membrane protein [Fodinibius roseus]SHF85284.1 Starch-binding associating with outer membrane [Fodinibius roseus]
MKSLTYTLLLLIAVIAGGCTDLADVDEDGISRETVGGSENEVSDPAAALRGVYTQLNDLRGAGGTFALMEHPSDELMGPTRGTDWSDFGVWRQLHLHTWDPSHAEVLNAWNQLNAGVFRATQVIDAGTADQQQKAEARFLRAFFMYYVMDFFGQVPFRPSDAGPNDIPEVYSRSEALEFIIDDLTAARPDLPTLTSSAAAATATREAVDFLLARLYLNRAVYTSSSAENPSAGPFTFEEDDMNEVIARVENLEANSYLALTDFYDNFHWNNTTLSDEFIFVIDEEEGGETTFNHFYMTLHYNHSPTGCCNGFTTTPDFYSRFPENTDDVRKSAYIPEMTSETGILAGFLEGQQYGEFNGPGDPVEGTALNDRGGNALVFTPEVDLFYANERMGIRVIKYLVNPDRPEEAGTDYVFFRYADALLMKAEAHFRKGESGQALDIINEIRDYRNASELSSVDEQTILNERGFELYWEGLRRTDQIRFGTFTEAWSEKEPSDPFRVLFPIPQRALDTNPNLIQNEGY